MGLQNQSNTIVSPSKATVNELIIDAIQDIKGKHIVQLDLTNIEEAPADFYIVCEGESTTQVKGIADRIQSRMRTEFNISPHHKEGVENSQWILLDYFDTIVHVFYPETRTFYQIEELWSDAHITEFENL